MPVPDPRLMTIFGEALELSDLVARTTYLDRVCGEDADLRRRVEALVAAHAGAGGFLEPDLARAAEPPPLISPDATLPPSPNPNIDTTSYSPVGEPTATLPPFRAEHAADGMLGTVRYFGDYELLSEIARGGMGVVWKARQTSLKREVALKMIRAGALAGPDEVERFLREAEAAANLQHPNIVAIHEVGEHDGQHYFSMDYVSGRDLGALVNDGPLGPQAAARYVKIIAEAIHFAHQRGTLHRDLKPQNVLIDTVDQPRITDFGLAKIMKEDSRLTQSGAVMGTPSYMPPEQASSQHGDIGPASDVYSLGAMLYELLTGRPPFRGTTAIDTLLQVLESEPTAPRRLKADIPPDLETICLKCLEKSPPARYPSARALAEELDRFLNGEPIKARPASAIRKLVSWIQRHPGVLAALAALVMVALTFGIYYLFEENAFLRAKLANPALLRVPGPRYEFLELARTIGSFASVAGIYLWFGVTKLARGLSFRDWFKPALIAQAPQPLGERTRTLAIAAGLVLVCCGVMLLVATIQAHVWEGALILRQIGFIYCSTYFGLAILGVVVRDYRMVHFGIGSGTSSQRLTAEQIEPISRALVDRDFRTAAEYYRDARPDASKLEAQQYVIRLYHSLRAENPDKFTLPPLSSIILNRNAMIICALIEGVILGMVMWYYEPPSHPILAVAQFIYSFLFGMALMAFPRENRLWKRMMLLIPALAVMVFGEAILPQMVKESSHSVGAYLFGFFFGMFMMISGFMPQRKQRV
jgi:tRNA A-37 threonylcarbamoyl transferase component Bud32